MKDITAAHLNRPAHRAAQYPRKRPSPSHGVVKASAAASNSSASRRHTSKHHSPALRQELLRQRDVLRWAQSADTRLLEQEYRAEVQRYMHDMEQCTMSAVVNMDQQPEIRWHMRPCLVDFLVEIHFAFRLRPETLYLTLNIVDRYVSRRVVYIKHYQLVGCAALWIAAKFEDAKERVPSVGDLARICSNTYEEQAFIQMEHHVLTTIQWLVGHPTAEAWLRLVSFSEDTKTQHVARFLMEITLFFRDFLFFTSSALAHGALILARYMTGTSRRPLEETEDALKVVELLDGIISKHADTLSETLIRKYAYPFYSKASTFAVQFYLEGKRFQRLPLPITPSYASAVAPPVTPARMPLQLVRTPSTASSEDSSMPVTPATPTGAMAAMVVDPFMAEVDKENLVPTHMTAASGKAGSMFVPKRFFDEDLTPSLAAQEFPGRERTKSEMLSMPLPPRRNTLGDLNIGAAQNSPIRPMLVN